MGLQQNMKRKTRHGKKKRNVPANDIMDSFKKGHNGGVFDLVVHHERSQNGEAPANGPPTASTSYQMEQRRISNRSSLQPKSRIQDNENVMANSGRVNKTQKKSKLKIQDHSEIESFRVGERYREKLNVNTSSNCWKITSVSVKNNHKTLA